MFNRRMIGLPKLALVMCLWLMLAERGRVTGMSLVRIMDDDDDRSMVDDDSLSTTEAAANQNRLILNGEPSASTLLESALKDLTLVNSAEETMTNDNVNLKQVDFDSLQAPIVASTATNEPVRFNEQDNGELALTFATSSPPTADIVHNYQPVKSKKKYLLMSTDSNTNTNDAMRKKLNKNHPRRFKTNNNNNNQANGNIKKIFKLDRSLQRVEKKSWNAPVQSISAYLEILNHSQSSQNKVSGIRNLLSSFNNS